MTIQTYRCAEHMTGAGRGQVVEIAAPDATEAARRYASRQGYASLEDMARQFGYGGEVAEFVRALVS